MDDVFAGADAAQAWLDELSADTEQQAEQARALADRVATLSVTATDTDGAVRVTVEASGMVTDLRLTDRMRGWPPERVAGQILAVMRAAQAQLAGRVAAEAAQTVGADSPIGRDVVAGYQARFPAPPRREKARSMQSMTDNRFG
jgi:DNA-binding protein YbaB